MKTLTKLPYLWHNVPNGMKGKLLWPLKALAEVEPEIAAAHKAKYIGREHIAQLHVPILDCRWDEVVFLSPIHPQLLNNAMHEAGHAVPSSKVFQISPASLLDHEAVWFDPKKSGVNGEVTAESVRALDWAKYISEDLSERARPYYKRCSDLNRRPLMLGTEIHVLVRGFTRGGKVHPVDISNAEMITTSVPPISHRR